MNLSEALTRIRLTDPQLRRAGWRLDGGTLADGTLVEVTPLKPKASTGAALIAAIEAAPRVPPEDVDELENAIEAGKRQVTTSDPWPPTEPAR